MQYVARCFQASEVVILSSKMGLHERGLRGQNFLIIEVLNDAILRQFLALFEMTVAY